MNVPKQYLIIFNAVNLPYKRQLEGITINLIVTFSKTLTLFSRYIRISTFANHYCKKLQEAGDRVSVCVLNIFPEVKTLPTLLATNLVKVEI